MQRFLQLVICCWTDPWRLPISVYSGRHTYSSIQSFFLILRLLSDSFFLPSFLCFPNFSLSLICIVSPWFDEEGLVGDNGRSGNHLHHSWHPPPLYVVDHFERYGDRLGGQWFSTTRLAGELREIFDACTGPMHENAVGAWTKRWRRWGGRVATTSLCHFSQTGSLFVRRFEHIVYKRETLRWQSLTVRWRSVFGLVHTPWRGTR